MLLKIYFRHPFVIILWKALHNPPITTYVFISVLYYLYTQNILDARDHHQVSPIYIFGVKCFVCI